jgi:hypothetical protein
MKLHFLDILLPLADIVATSGPLSGERNNAEIVLLRRIIANFKHQDCGKPCNLIDESNECSCLSLIGLPVNQTLQKN